MMSICTNCGAIMHPEDVLKHICKAGNIPVKGTEKLPTTTGSAVL